MQSQFGADKVAVLLIDIDESYSGKSPKNVSSARKVLSRSKVDWPNAIIPDGWVTALKTFNSSGYGTIVVDRTGIVRGINVHGKEFEALVAKCLDSKSAELKLKDKGK